MPNPVINRRMTGGAKFNAAPCAVRLSVVGAGDSFECYPDPTEELSSLPLAGVGFSGRWVGGENVFGVKDLDSFESYSGVAGMDGGTGWSGSWLLSGV